MSASPGFSALAPFRVRRFRFQWPADLATSWALEMETLILGWYVLVETESVLLLTVFASLQQLGTLIAPMFGVIGDRIGQRNLLSMMRAFYALLAAILMMFAFTGILTPVHVFVITFLTGLVRPSDMGMRAALVAEIIPSNLLLAGMSISRTTSDSARIAGALTGTALFATLGMGAAYVLIVSLYMISVVLTWKVGDTRPNRSSASAGTDTPARASPWRELKEGLAYVWSTPVLFAVMCLAFLLNLTAFPLQTALLPYVAKELYATNQTGLGYMAAGAAFGALTGSITLSHFSAAIRPARMMIIFSAAWCIVLLVFVQVQHPVVGGLILAVSGCMQSMSQIPMAATLMRGTAEKFRGRVMGIRMLAIYGGSIGILISGPLISRFGYQATGTLYSLIALTSTIVIATRWRAHLWRRDAPVNKR